MEKLKYIQNRRHWCWAVACKIVGEQYKRLHGGYDFTIIGDSSIACGNVTAYEYEHGVVTDNQEGINWALQHTDVIRVDAWQRAVVMNANTNKYIGYDGDASGDDEAKARGIKYYLTGDIYSDKVRIETLGFHDDMISVWDKYRNQIMASIRHQEYLIGNAVLQDRNDFHSYVILCIEGSKAMLYDAADGNILYCNVEEVFKSGFKSGSGRGIIKWVQRIV